MHSYPLCPAAVWLGKSTETASSFALRWTVRPAARDFGRGDS